jgi:hypothetical protein
MNTETDVKQTKTYRNQLDGILQDLKGNAMCDGATHHRSSRERSIAITKIQEAIMWLGMDLKDLGTPNPYPESYNPENATVEPTADGLSL